MRTLRIASPAEPAQAEPPSHVGSRWSTRDGAAVYAPEPDPRGRRGRVHCLEFPDTIHDAGRIGYDGVP